jgi:starch synthase
VKILHVASEVAPYSKTGGLADVLQGLPRALGRLGADVTVVAPRYGFIDPDRFGLARWLRSIPVPMGSSSVEVGVYEGTPPGGARVKLYLVDHPASFDRGDALYGHPDDAFRFTLLGRAALAIAAHLGRWPDVLHGHDWQSGPALVYARGAMGDLKPPKMIFTIHNLAYQGLFPEAILDELGLPRDLWHPEGFEFWGHVSFLKAGIMLADHITTVSPRYAREIQTEEQGVGFDGILRARTEKLTGILNGVDYDVWSPEKDPHLPHNYSAESLGGKRVCKERLQRELGLPMRPETPLCGSISRLVEQKGFDLVLGALPQILEADVQYVQLGTGEPRFVEGLLELQKAFPKKLAVRVAYDEGLAHRIEAGCDLFVMPSRFEPCGLNQLYSLRYGTPPIVRATGGLDDSIVDYEPRSRSGTGFKFEAYTKEALLDCWRHALHAYRENRSDFTALQKRGMAQDFSWNSAAQRYLELYERVGGNR